MAKTALRPARRIGAAPPAPPPHPAATAEQLADWYSDQTASLADDLLADIVQVLGSLPNQERTVAMNLTLARARQQQEKRARQRGPAVSAAAPPAPASSPAAAPGWVPFSPAEQAIIRQHYATAQWAELLAALPPHRTQQSVRDWANKHGLVRTAPRFRTGPRRSWLPEEDQVLRERYRQDGVQALAERLNRPVAAVRSRAHVLGCARKQAGRPAPLPAPPVVARPVRPVPAPVASKPAKESKPAKAVAPVAQSGSAATPVLNARVAARLRQDSGLSPIGRMLAEMRRLPGGHPRRLAYAAAARTGTGLDAYEAWKNWKPAKAA